MNSDSTVFSQLMDFLPQYDFRRCVERYDGNYVELEHSAYALDSTTIDLCLSLFPWAKFRTHKAGVKLHTLMDLHGNIPTMSLITNAKVHDVNILDLIIFEPGALYIMDRGYMDFSRLHTIHLASAFFITRAKSNFRFKRHFSHAVDKTTSLRSDQTIVLKGFYARKDFPGKLRRIRYYDATNKKYMVFLTNNSSLPALTIAELYRCRWQVELFFKWMKQHLRIKSFYGTSDNTVKIPIWIAISVYVLVAIVKKHLNTNLNLYTILQILSVSLFEKIPIFQALSPDYCEKSNEPDLYPIEFIQLMLGHY
jgi:hypothetical protein